MIPDGAVHGFLDRSDTTVYVMTTRRADERDGAIVTFVTQASIDPVRLLVCTSHENRSHELVEATGALALQVVPEDRPDWVTRFGRIGGAAGDKLAGTDWEDGATGVPVLMEAAAVLECRVVDSWATGDHTARLCEPVTARVLRPEVRPLRLSDLLRDGSVEPSGARPPPW